MLTENQQYHLEAMKLLGIDTDKYPYEKCVSQLIHRTIALQRQIEIDNKDLFEQELNRVLKPTN